MAYTPAFPAPIGARRTGRQRLDLDRTRIAANAGAIAINTVALLLLMAPIALPPPPAPAERVIEATWVKPKRDPTPAEVPIERKPAPRQTSAASTTRVAPAPVTGPVVDSEPDDKSMPPTEPVLEAEPGDAVDITPQAASSAPLQALSSPSPAYPIEAIRAGLTGTVELEILVGADGKPLEVRIVRSSGHRLLDQAARKIVLSQWRFDPAMRDGRQVQARGRVPIAFTLER